MAPLKARLVLLACVLGLGACARSPGTAKTELVAADKALSARAAKEGAQAALLEAVTTDAKLLAQYQTGPQGVQEAFMQLPADVKLSWEPAYAEAAGAGDLGYTWGRYQMIFPGIQRKGVAYTERGYYVNIWKREHGRWRLAFSGSTKDTR